MERERAERESETLSDCEEECLLNAIEFHQLESNESELFAYFRFFFPAECRKSKRKVFLNLHYQSTPGNRENIDAFREF